MNTELMKAVDDAMIERAITAAMRQCHTEGVAMSDKRWEYFPSKAAWREAIKQALRDLEAENARLQSIADGNTELYQHELLRAEKADALLRYVLRYLDPRQYAEAINRVEAHLQGSGDEH